VWVVVGFASQKQAVLVFEDAAAKAAARSRCAASLLAADAA
jgi:hypothetical protein